MCIRDSYISNAKKIAAEQTNDEFIEISIYSEIDIFNVGLELYQAIPNVEDLSLIHILKGILIIYLK